MRKTIRLIPFLAIILTTMTSNTKASIFLLVCIVAAAGYLFYRLNEDVAAQERQAEEFDSRELKGNIKSVALMSVGFVRVRLNITDTEYNFLPEANGDTDLFSFAEVGDLFIKHSYADSVTVVHKGISQRFKLGGR